MADNITTNCLNGELKPGDLVLSTPAAGEDYAYLVGIVLRNNKAGTPEQRMETDNLTDDIHVNFMLAAYSDKRVREIEAAFTDAYERPMEFDVCPIDDVIMAPEMLLRITDFPDMVIDGILESYEKAEIYFGIAMADISQNNEITAEQSGFITEKLYSPLFVKIVADENEEEYGGDYWNDPLSQRDAAYYEDKIHEAILKERLDDEGERGLMEYFHDGGSVDEKVRSLFVDVEIHDGKLWGVAALELTELLTPDEYAELKDYLSGQYSDGFGEGFEQRGFRVSDGELYVSLWEYGDKFFIDTSLEFQQRLGITLPGFEQGAAVPATPPQTAIYEQDAENKVSDVDLRKQLISRLDMNISGYIDTIRNLDDKGIMDFSWEIAARMSAYHYMTEQHSFKTPELEFLLKFKNPLEVVADAFVADDNDNRSYILWKIADREYALEDDYEFMPDSPAAAGLETQKRELFDRLDANLSDYCMSLMDTDKDEIIGMAESIAARHSTRHYLQRYHEFKDGEVGYLLSFKDPLSVIAEGWPGLINGYKDLSGLVENILADRDSHKTHAKIADITPPAPMEASARGRNSGEKPSVLEQIRNAARTPKAPRSDQPPRRKDGPEL